jgi:hypothetical protein
MIFGALPRHLVFYWIEGLVSPGGPLDISQRASRRSESEPFENAENLEDTRVRALWICRGPVCRLMSGVEKPQ